MSTADGDETAGVTLDRTDASRGRIHHRKAIVLVVVAVLVAALAATITGVLIGWSTGAASSCDNPVDNSREIIVDATVITVDTADQEASMRLDFAPFGSLVNDKDQTLAQPVDVLVQGLTATPSSVDSVSTFSYAKGEYMQSLPVTVPLGGISQLTSGSTSQLQSSQFGVYPWDHYTIPNYLDFEVVTPGERAPYTCVYVNSQAEGWSSTIEAVSSPTNQFDLNLWRSPPVLIYNYFMMALVWTLAIAGVALAIMLVLRDRGLKTKERIGVDVFIYLAALLFAFPLIRSTLPGAPEFGTLVDIVSYFWAEVIVAATLLSMVVVWVIREDRRHREHVRSGLDAGAAGPPADPEPDPEPDPET